MELNFKVMYSTLFIRAIELQFPSNSLLCFTQRTIQSLAFESLLPKGCSLIHKRKSQPFVDKIHSFYIRLNEWTISSPSRLALLNKFHEYCSCLADDIPHTEI